MEMVEILKERFVLKTVNKARDERVCRSPLSGFGNGTLRTKASVMLFAGMTNFQKQCNNQCSR
jgi:hypothetical protein